MNLFAEDGFRDPVALLQAERAEHGTMQGFLDGLQRRYSASLWLGTITRISVIVEPTDRTLGIDSELQTANAFYVGCLIGLHVVEQCTPRAIKEKVPGVQLALPPGPKRDEDALQNEHENAETIVMNGERGLDSFPALAHLIGAWEDEITSDITRQPFIRRGFGLMLYAIHEANQARIQADMERVADAGQDWDWDGALKGLTS
jgi:hypothetical protein